MTYEFPALLPKLYSFTEPFIFSKILSDSRVLDVGCGDGYLTKRIIMNTKAKQVVAVDINGDILMKAERTQADTRIEYVLGDGEDSELFKIIGGFDFILLRNTFHHFDDKEKFLTNFYNLLNKSGVLLILDLDKEANYSLLGLPIPLLVTFWQSVKINGLIETTKILWNTKFFLNNTFRMHRHEDRQKLKLSGWLTFQEVSEKVMKLLPGCKVARLGSVCGYGGCYYVLYQK